MNPGIDLQGTFIQSLSVTWAFRRTRQSPLDAFPNVADADRCYRRGTGQRLVRT